MTSVRHHDLQVARGIRKIRYERDWRLADMAIPLTCDPSQVSRIENDERSAPDAHEVADMLGVPVSYLLDPCSQCNYRPPHGYMCLLCGTAGMA